MNKVVLLFVLLPLASLCQKNKATLDSLEKAAAQQADSALVKTYNELTWEYRLVDRDKAIEYGNKAIHLGTTVHFPKGVAQAYNDLGIIYYDREEYDTAISLYQHAVTIREDMNDQLGIAKLYNKIGIVYQKTGNFEKALDYQLKALPLFEQFHNDIGISYSLNNIGILQQNLGRLPEAISYHQRSIAIKEKLGDNYGLAGSYVNLANIYLLQKNYNAAESYYKKAIAIARELGDKEYLSNALNNLGTQYTGTKKYEAALPLIRESYMLRNELADTKGMVSCLNNMADIYIEQQRYDTAKVVLEDAIARARRAVNCAPELNKLYLTSSKLYERTGDLQKALDLYKQYAATKDSLFSDNLSESFAELETKYETVKKEQKIAEEQHKQQQLQASVKLQRSLIIGIAGLVLLVGLLIHSRYKRNKLKQEARLQAAILHQQELATKAVLEAEEEERKRIARDLHDGVGQMMSAAKMNLSAFESSLQLQDAGQKIALDKVITLVDESCREVRSVSHNMMPNALLKNSLAAAVQDFIDKLDSKALKIHLYTEGLDQRLDSNTETVLYRVIQECVNNVIKHADANTLDISVIRDRDGISATIEDNGKGFDRQAADHRDGIGLKNILTRVEYLKGTVDFDSRPGQGTVVAVHVPLS